MRASVQKVHTKRVSLHGYASIADIDTVRLRFRIAEPDWEEQKLQVLGRGNKPMHTPVIAEMIASSDTSWYPRLHDTVMLRCPLLRVADRAIKARRAGDIAFSIQSITPLPARTRSSNRIHRFVVHLALEDVV